MELKDLQSAWSKYVSAETDKHRLDETELQKMLKRRASGLIDRIDRNVKIGYAVVFVLVLFFAADDFFLTPNLSDGLPVPSWIYLVDALTTLLILGTFIFFSVQYNGVKKHYLQSNDMKKVLKSAIQLLSTYRRLFYVVLFTLLVVVAVTFVTGLFFGLEVAANRQGVDVGDLNRSQMITVLIGGLLLLTGAVSLLFFLFRWGFRRLYGRYIDRLKETLAELEEIE